MTVIPFTGRQAPARSGPAGDARHPLPWTADEDGIIRDAAGTVIGSAVEPGYGSVGGAGCECEQR